MLEVEGARAPVPHSWRRHCLYSLHTNFTRLCIF